MVYPWPDNFENRNSLPDQNIPFGLVIFVNSDVFSEKSNVLFQVMRLYKILIQGYFKCCRPTFSTVIFWTVFHITVVAILPIYGFGFRVDSKRAAYLQYTRMYM